MVNYTPPDSGNIIFTFSEGGYSKPDFNDLSFKFAEKNFTSDLQGSINVLQLYQDSTYTYVKECETVVIGYGTSGIQTLKLPCKYGGIRDLGSTILPILQSRDLSATIAAGNATIIRNLYGFIRTEDTDSSSIYGRLIGNISSHTNLNTSVIGDYIKVNLPSKVKLLYINNLNASMLPTLLKGSLDLTVLFKTYLRNSLDLNSYLNIIETKDLHVNILPNLLHGMSNIKACTRVYQKAFVDLNVYFRGWDERQLPANLRQINFSNLKGRILSTLDLDLQAYLDIIPPADLNSNIIALDYRNLKSSILSTYGPTDLPTYLNSVEPKNLKGVLYSFRGLSININLPATVTSLYERNLSAYLNSGGSYDLTSSIVASGDTKNLYAYLFPKVVHVKKAFTITLLSIKDLFCAVNSSCFRTGYKNLGTSLYSYDNKNLGAYLMSGHNVGGDLSARINSDEVIVIDTIGVKFFPDKKYTTMHMGVESKASGITFDTISTVYYKKTLSSSANIAAYIKSITSTTTYRNLPASLTTIIDAPFTTTTSHKNRFKVLDLNNKNYSNWKREIEVLFGSQAKNYRYITANKRAYRESREHHWIISVVGFNYVPGIGVERGKVRKKYIFNLSNYKDVDEAIRDAIDRVSAFRKSNLESYINGVNSLYNYKNLKVNILVRNTGKGLRNLWSMTKGVSEITTSNLPTNLITALPITNLSASIIGYNYVPPSGGKVDFNFSGEDKVEFLEKNVDLDFKKGS